MSRCLIRYNIGRACMALLVMLSMSAFCPEADAEQVFKVLISNSVRSIAADADDKHIEEMALACEKVKTAMAGKTPRKVIVAKPRIVSIIT